MAYVGIIDAAGTVGTLVVVLWALYSGRLVPVSVVGLLCEQAARDAVRQMEERGRGKGDHPTRPTQGD